ncbi:MAG: reprolysin-like metallopeptidase, partial [Panacibacter sp.]
MRKILLLTTLLAMTAASGFSQGDNYWSANNASHSSFTTDKAVSRLTYPKSFKLFSLNIVPLRQALISVVDKRSSKHSIIISVPNAAGNIEKFEVYEASNFEPALQAKFPEIRAFSGKGITDKYASIKLSISPQGIQTMIFRTEKDDEFIEPYSKDHQVYSVYSVHRDKESLPWTCSTDDKISFTDISRQITNQADLSGTSTGQLKTMRLAQSCNGEYANYFGATSSSQVGLVLAAFNATLTRCNGVYEKDLALHLNLIANTTSVIYYNPSTDPYSTTLSQWN